VLVNIVRKSYPDVPDSTIFVESDKPIRQTVIVVNTFRYSVYLGN